MTAIDSLQRIRRRPDPIRPGTACDLCATPIDVGHRHLVDPAERSLKCACRACALLFDRPGSTGGHFRTVPDRWVRVAGFGGFAALELPVGVAFVFTSSVTGQASAFYPGPAGATESMLAMGTWEELVAGHPELRSMEPDVEAALLVSEPSPRCFVVPIDACYQLVGRLRRTWRGFDGGQEARQAMDEFFAMVAGRA